MTEQDSKIAAAAAWIPVIHLEFVGDSIAMIGVGHGADDESDWTQDSVGMAGRESRSRQSETKPP